jgi:hypothetical protein
MLSKTLISLNDVPKSTSAAAAAKPLNGIFALSNFAFVTAASAMLLLHLASASLH